MTFPLGGRSPAWGGDLDFYLMGTDAFRRLVQFSYS